MNIMPGAVLAALFAAVPFAASADTSPLMNRVIIYDALQQQMQNQLNTQQIRLQAQHDLMRANVQRQLQQDTLTLQYLLLQQQLQTLKLQQQPAQPILSSSHKQPQTP